jgi:hypothetical protein
LIVKILVPKMRGSPRKRDGELRAPKKGVYV